MENLNPTYKHLIDPLSILVNYLKFEFFDNNGIAHIGDIATLMQN